MLYADFVEAFLVHDARCLLDRRKLRLTFANYCPHYSWDHGHGLNHVSAFRWDVALTTLSRRSMRSTTDGDVKKLKIKSSA